MEGLNEIQQSSVNSDLDQVTIKPLYGLSLHDVIHNLWVNDTCRSDYELNYGLSSPLWASYGVSLVSTCILKKNCSIMKRFACPHSHGMNKIFGGHCIVWNKTAAGWLSLIQTWNPNFTSSQHIMIEITYHCFVPNSMSITWMLLHCILCCFQNSVILNVETISELHQHSYQLPNLLTPMSRWLRSRLQYLQCISPASSHWYASKKWVIC